MGTTIIETPVTLQTQETVTSVSVSTTGIPLLPPGGEIGQVAVRTDGGYDWYFLVNTDPVQPAQGEFPGQMWAPPA